MSDPFGVEEVGNEPDPAADFIKTSEEQLGDFADEVLGGGGGTEQNEVDNNVGVDDFLGQGDPFESATTNIGGEVQSNEAFDEMNGFGIEEDAGVNTDEEIESNDLYSAIAQVDTDKKVPEKIKLWREEFATRIENKDVLEAEDKEAWQNLAKKELEEWNAREAEQLEKKKTDNRIAEAEWIKERDEDIPGQQWEKVGKLVDFNPKNSKCSKDTSRMRSILLHLKQRKGGKGAQKQQQQQQQNSEQQNGGM